MLTYTKSHKMTILLYKAVHIYKVCTHVLDFHFALCLERKLKNLTIKICTYTEGLQRALRDPRFAFNLKLGIQDFKAKWGRDGGLKVYAEGGMQKITLGITVLQERLGRDYEIENPVGNPLTIEKLKEPELNKQFRY